MDRATYVRLIDTIDNRRGRATALYMQRARPRPSDGEWIEPQSISIESFDEQAYSGFSLGEDLVVLRRDEAIELLGEPVPEPDGDVRCSQCGDTKETHGSQDADHTWTKAVT